MTDRQIVDQIKDFGIDFKRLSAALNHADNWGGMVHAFEYLTVLGVVEDAMRKDEEETT